MTITQPPRVDHRRRRSNLKADLRLVDKYTAAKRVQTLIVYPPGWAEQMRVRDLLLAIPSLGPSKVTHALSCRNIGQHRTIQQLSDRQRESIHTWLEAV